MHRLSRLIKEWKSSVVDLLSTAKTALQVWAVSLYEYFKEEPERLIAIAAIIGVFLLGMFLGGVI